MARVAARAVWKFFSTIETTTFNEFVHALRLVDRLSEDIMVSWELTARKRNCLFSYAGYIEIMSRCTELPGR